VIKDEDKSEKKDRNIRVKKAQERLALMKRRQRMRKRFGGK